MGRLFIELDPPGYTRLTERGYDKEFTGARLAELLQDKGGKDASGSADAPVIRSGNFWNPPGSNSLLPKPRHHDGYWYQSPLQQDYILRKDLWHFAGGLSVREFQPTRKPDGVTFEQNQWFDIASIPHATTSLDNTNFTAMGAVLDAALPAGIKTVAFCDSTPTGHKLTDADFHPYLRFVQYPTPIDTLIFGMANLAFVFNAGKFSVVRTPKNDKQNWELLASGSLGSGGGIKSNLPTYDSPYLATAPITPVVREFEVIPVYPDHLFVRAGGGDSKLIKLRTSTMAANGGAYSAGRLFGAGLWGAWWIASPPGHPVVMQCQLVGYTTASTDPLNTPTPRTHFDLGESYKPTQEPQLHFIRHHNPTFGDGALFEETSDLPNETVSTNLVRLSQEQIVVGLRDEKYEPWVSNGTHQKGTFRIRLRPDSAYFGATYLAPQIANLILKFPLKRVARGNVRRLLSDATFSNLKVATSLREFYGKRINFVVYEDDDTPDAERLNGTGLDTRERYPVHILEEVDPEDEETWLVRARGWVHKVNTLEPLTEAGDGEVAPIRRYFFECHGLLRRADTGWLYAPEIVNPDASGRIEHDFAVKDTLEKVGFDLDQEGVFDFSTDQFKGTNIARLPGTAAELPQLPGTKNDGAWNPDWNETAGKYIDRIARQWRGWRCYESGAVIHYHPDLVIALLAKQSYWVSATLYRTTDEARAAAEEALEIPDPEREARWAQMVMQGEPERWGHPMKGNTVRVTGKAPEKNANPHLAEHVIDRNKASIEDQSRDDFLGDEVVIPVVSKLAVGKRALKQIALVLKKLECRKEQGWNVRVQGPAPWEFEPNPIAVGHCLELKGEGKGDTLIVHLEWELVGMDQETGRYLYVTRLACERLPEGSKRADSPSGQFPGHGGSGSGSGG